MITYKEIQAYYASLYEAFRSQKESNKFNKDRSHNATVFRFMLDHSKIIKMYCGELSIFRGNFFRHVIKNAQTGEGEKIMGAMNESLRTFLLKKDTRLIIVIENYNPKLLDDIVEQNFITAIRNGKVELRKLNENLSFKKILNHFTVTDSKIIRAEQSKEEHSAICTMNSDAHYQIINASFNKLYSLSEAVNLS